jgi:hypothetical protein
VNLLWRSDGKKSLPLHSGIYKVVLKELEKCTKTVEQIWGRLLITTKRKSSRREFPISDTRLKSLKIHFLKHKEKILLEKCCR